MMLARSACSMHSLIHPTIPTQSSHPHLLARSAYAPINPPHPTNPITTTSPHTDWQAEDEARTLARRHEAARSLRTAAAAEAAAAQAAAQGLLLAEELRAKEGLAKVGDGLCVCACVCAYVCVCVCVCVCFSASRRAGALQQEDEGLGACEFLIILTTRHPPHLPPQLESDRLLRRLAEQQADATARQAALQQERERMASAAVREALRDQAEEGAERARRQHDRLAAIRAEQGALAARQAALREAAADLERCVCGVGWLVGLDRLLGLGRIQPPLDHTKLYASPTVCPTPHPTT